MATSRVEVLPAERRMRESEGWASTTNTSPLCAWEEWGEGGCGKGRESEGGEGVESVERGREGEEERVRMGKVWRVWRESTCLQGMH